MYDFKRHLSTVGSSAEDRRQIITVSEATRFKVFGTLTWSFKDENTIKKNKRKNLKRYSIFTIKEMGSCVALVISLAS
jgi:hypothetical protein